MSSYVEMLSQKLQQARQARAEQQALSQAMQQPEPPMTLEDHRALNGMPPETPEQRRFTERVRQEDRGIESTTPPWELAAGALAVPKLVMATAPKVAALAAPKLAAAVKPVKSLVEQLTRSPTQKAMEELETALVERAAKRIGHGLPSGPDFAIPAEQLNKMTTPEVLEMLGPRGAEKLAFAGRRELEEASAALQKDRALLDKLIQGPWNSPVPEAARAGANEVTRVAGRK